MAEAKGVLVIGQTSAGALDSTAAELLAAGGTVAKGLGEELSIALLGDSVDGPAQQSIAHGAERVYAVTSPLLSDYHPDLYLAALNSLCREMSPRVVLLSRTNEGRELAPRLAFRLGVGLAQDCLEVSVDESSKTLLANRPVYGGNAIAVVSCEQTPQVAAIRPKAYEPTELNHSRQGQVVSFPVDLDASLAKTRVVEMVREESLGVKLEDARVVVSGGRGLGGPEPFSGLEALAKLLGGAVGASRAAVGLRVGAVLLPGGTDRQVHHAGPVHHSRHIRGQPAHGRVFRRQVYRCHQQGRGRQYIQGRALRCGGGLGKGDSCAHRGCAGADGQLKQSVPTLILGHGVHGCAPLFISGVHCR